MIELPHNQYRLDRFLINCQEMTISCDDQSSKLPVKVFELLKLFIANPNHTVEIIEAIEKIWNGNEAVGKRGYTNAMWHLRKAFTEVGGENEALFRTLPKVGYMLEVAPEAIIGDAAASSEPVIKTRTLMLIAPIVAVIAALVIALWILLNPQQAKIVAPLETVRITNFEGIEEQPAISHDGHYMAFTWVREQQKGKLYIKDLHTADAPLRAVTMVDAEEASPAWSPDGESLAYVRINSSGQCQVFVKQLMLNQDQLLSDSCYYKRYRKTLDWSSATNELVFSVATEDKVALVAYDFATQSVRQLTTPAGGEKDIEPQWSSSGDSIAFIREHYQQAQVILLNANGVEEIVMDFKVSIVGLFWDHQHNALYVSYAEDGRYAISRINLADNSQQIVLRQGMPSNLSMNPQTGELYFSNHSSSEYIVQRSLVDEREIRRASSSSRDMYGQYVRQTSDVVFVSNRSGSWNVWLKNAKGSRNLTAGMGNVTVPAVSPDGKHYAVSIRAEGAQQHKFYLGSLDSDELKELDLQGKVAQHPSWSEDSRFVYFSTRDADEPGAYKFEVATGDIIELSAEDAYFMREVDANALFASRENQNGIWFYDLAAGTSTKVVDNLEKRDFAAFFVQDQQLYYLARTAEYDNLMRYVSDGDDEIVVQYPARSVRSFHGVSPADFQSFMVTLNSINDADIYALPLR